MAAAWESTGGNARTSSYLLVSELAMAKNCEEPHIEEMLSRALAKSKLRFPEASDFVA